MPKDRTTRRAYTLRLTSIDRADNSWRHSLWSTHKVVNLGAKAFGDWLLMLRGGISHGLAEDIDREKLKSQEAIDRETRNRRVLLALSWLTVESRRGAPKAYIVSQDGGKWKTVQALREILKKRGLADADIDFWVQDCTLSLEAPIRDDAVWVNRSQAFDEAVYRVGPSLTREGVWDILGRFFGNEASYLKPVVISAEDEVGAGVGKNTAVADNSAPDLVQQAIGWLSDRFGQGKGADFEALARAYEKIALWAQGVLPSESGSSTVASLGEYLKTSPDIDSVLGVISGPGHKSKTRNLLKQISISPAVDKAKLQQLGEYAQQDQANNLRKIGKKGPLPYSDFILKAVETTTGMPYRQSTGRTHQQEYSVILDHAARHVVVAHTWLKRIEAERLRFEGDAAKQSLVPDAAKQWLDEYCRTRTETTGSLGEYLIRPRAVVGWERVVKAWSQKGCSTIGDRKSAVRQLQGELEKFGDANLFSELAADDATCVWLDNGNPDHKILLNYVDGTNALANKRRFKVPAYRHPDPLWHPIFCDFGNSRWKISFAAYEQGKQNGSRKRKVTSGNKRELSINLWTGEELKETSLQWQSKRLTRDLALSQASASPDSEAIGVSRADRFGRAAAGANSMAPIEILGLYDSKTNWNGRLQAPRYELERLGIYLEEHGLSCYAEDDWDEKAKVMRDRINWLVTFSAPLQPNGPWMEYARSNNLSPNPQAWPHSVENKKRKKRARLILSRLPGLRILSVDLGHRYAAACAVWEAVTSKQVKAACDTAGQPDPAPDAVYLHLKGPDGKTTIYRRIGGDILPNGGVHPAPWARLDRQFLIKLQGEGEPARKASPAEIEMVREIENSLGYRPPKQRSWQVNELSADTVDVLRRGLKRHGICARIGFNLQEATRERSWDSGEQVKQITDALEDWYTLFVSNGWSDEWAKGLWERRISPLLSDKDLPNLGDNLGGASARKKRQEDLRNELQLAVERLTKEDCLELHNLWAERWRRDDTDWRIHLRKVRDWILPRGSSSNSGAILHKGGLSLTRIATIKSLYQIQKAYAMRPEPDDMQKNFPNNHPDFGRSILDQLEQLRQNRVKQLASRIVEAALGVGIEGPSGKGRGRKRPQERIDEARFAPCHAVVIEDLTHYRTLQIRTRRENRQLMNWSASKVKRYLKEACLLHGLHLREVNPRYTSRQDSRTGASGRRCSDIPVADFVHAEGYWKQRVRKAQERLEQGGNAVEDRLLCDLSARWDENKSMWQDERGVFWILTETNSWQSKGSVVEPGAAPRPVRIPRKGGEVFVSSEQNSPVARGIQADLNAAANIGLKALLDPDWPGSWWYVPCSASSAKPVKAEVKGSHAFHNVTTLRARESKGSKRKGEVINLWCDVSSTPLEDSGRREWQSYPEYWSKRNARVVGVLRAWAGLGKKYER